MKPNEYWKYKISHYEGIFDTHLRAKLTYFLNGESNKEEQKQVIYSNTFKGGVNPAQFWRRSSYGMRYSLGNLIRNGLKAYNMNAKCP